MRDFSQVDVFTSEFTYGNPVAVVHEADGLSTDAMASFARWTNLSETTFLLSPTDLVADYRLRIFTTEGELPFAGHPTLGSARAWLEAGGEPKAGINLVQECEAGLIKVRRDADRLAFAAPPLRRSGAVDSADIERATLSLGLVVEQIVDAHWADNGPGWLALLLSDAESVLKLETPSRSSAENLIGVIGPHDKGGPADFEVRAFVGSKEDPVTGSLNAAIAQWLVPAGIAPRTYTVAQGTVLKRRGRVYIDVDDGETWVGGDTVLGVTGKVEL